MSFHSRFLIAQSTSMLGAWIQQVAILQYAHNLRPNAVDMAFLVIMGQLPLILGLTLSGRWGDRIGRGRAWKWSQIFGACVASLCAALNYFHLLQWPVLVVTMVLIGFISTLDIANRQGFVMDQSEHTHHAIALDMVALNLARVIGPLIGGYLTIHQMLTEAYIVNAATYTFTAITLWRYFHRSPKKINVESSKVFHTNKSWNMIAVAIATLGAMTVPITSQYVSISHVLGGSAMLLAAMYSLTGLGALLINSTWSRNGNLHVRYNGVLFSIIVGCTFLSLLGYALYSKNSTIGLIAFFLHGIGNALSLSTLQSIAQQFVPVSQRAWSTSTLHRNYMVAGCVMAYISSKWIEQYTMLSLIGLELVLLFFLAIYLMVVKSRILQSLENQHA